MIARVRLVATTRGQEVHLIRGSEWQTGVRLCPTGVRTALHQGFEPDRRSCKGGEDEAGARLSTKSAPSNAMIANLISSRSLISPEEGGVSFRPLRRKCLYFHRAVAAVHLVHGLLPLSSARIHLTPCGTSLVFPWF